MQKAPSFQWGRRSVVTCGVSTRLRREDAPGDCGDNLVTCGGPGKKALVRGQEQGRQDDSHECFVPKMRLCGKPPLLTAPTRCTPHANSSIPSKIFRRKIPPTTMLRAVS